MTSYPYRNSQKISEFTVENILTDADLFTFVRNATNLNIPFSQFKLALGVTGSLTSVGNAFAPPVLTGSGTDYQIRAIESSKGVVATVSAENGINVACNFTQDNSGFPLIPDLNASQYKFKTLKAGSNIGIIDDGDSLEIGVIPTASTTKTVIVSEESDFPTPVGGVITLANDTDYLIVDDVSTSNSFAIGTSTVLRAASSQLIQLTYTGAGDMFTGTNPSFKIRDITVSCPNGNLFNVTSAAPSSIIQLIETNVQECETLGTISGAFIVRLTNVAFEDIKTKGFTFSGSNLYFSMNTILAFIRTGILFDFGTSTFRSMSISNGVVEATGAGVTFMSGLASSGNIVAGGLATVNNNKTFNVDTQLSGITSKDDRWEFNGNNNIADTMNFGLVSTTTNALETTIVSTGVPVKVNAVFVDSDLSRFTADGTGRLTYSGDSNSILDINVSSALLGASGGDKQSSLYIAINGAVVAATAIQATTNSSKAGSASTIWQYDFNKDDYVEVWVANETDTTNIVAQDVVLRVS